MAWLSSGAALAGGALPANVGLAELEIVETPAGPLLVAVTQPGAGGGISSFTLTGGAAPVLADQVTFNSDPSVLLQNDVSVAEIDGEVVLLLSGFGEAGLLGRTVSGSGQLGQAFALTPSDGSMATAPQSVVALASGAQTFVFAADALTGGVQSYVVGQGNSLLAAGNKGDTETSYLADVADFATVTIGGTDYLLTVSSTEPGVMVHSIDAATGQLTETGSLGAEEGLGIAGSSAIEVAEIGGQTYAIVAGTNSSSISVLKVGADGALTATDHIIDSLGTRFANLTALEVVEVGDWVFVFAGGGDDGLSMFALMPDGTLVHLQTVIDSLALSLENVSALAAAVVGGEIQLYAASATEDGLTQFTVAAGSLGGVIEGDWTSQTLTGTAASDLIQGGSGNEILRGNAGDDILKDGAGSDTLIGGAGADIFVLSADGATDTIQDFQPGVDKLDLSSWPMLYGTGQLGYQLTATGAILTYRNETLVIQSASGTSLSLTQIFGAGISGPYRPPLVLFTPGDSLTGTPGPDTLTGTAGNDTISGLDGDDRLFGNDGDDSILGGGGSDVIFGGDGDDMIDGGSHFDTIYGGAGNDTVWGGNGVDTVVLGDGDDVFYDNAQTGGFGIDWVAGGNGNDRLYGDGGNDALLGGYGNDTLYGGVGDDKLWGHFDDDVIHGGEGNDTVWGGDGADWASLGNGNDTYYESGQTGPQAADTVFGDGGDDRILTGSGNDEIHGGSGNDRIYAGNDDDLVFGDAGADEIHGGAGNDTVYGGTGRDVIYLNQGDDVFYDDAETGFAGSDRVYGHLGDDTFYSGGGNDTLWGGSGADTFVFYTGNEVDTIADFEDGIDIIVFDVAGLDYGGLTLTQSGSTAVITYSGGTIQLSGFSLADLGQDDFVFL